ncbi:phosphonate C-P lyase system protein PhnH [Rhodobacterales bacterium HKCCE2091]|nr:phosphonate C-P lyase system protein PhnH [Rhodobacterales bacterium HKCCE2091]
MQATALSGGFADPARDAARAFRAIMTAMARPGSIHALDGAAAPPPISPAAATVLLTLADPDTPVWLSPALSTPEVLDWIAFHTGAPLSAHGAACFAVGHWSDLPLADLPAGTPAYPDRSATVIVEVDRLALEGARLTGPGIEAEARLNLPDPAAFRANAARFPLGLDFVFCAGREIACLPRSTRIGGA